MQKNYFELFSLPVDYVLEPSELLRRYQTLQQQYHPDRFSQEGPQAKRLSTQISSLLNDAYQTLSDPLKRAIYLLKLQGMDLGLETDTQFSRDFLLEQLEWQEAIEELQQSPNPEKAQKLLADIHAIIQEHEHAIREAFHQNDLSAARHWVRQLQFFIHLREQLRLL